MKYCTKCGTSIPDDSKFCPACGQATDGSCSSQGTDYKNKVNNAVNEFVNTKDETDSYDFSDINNNKVLAALSYIGILFIVPLLAAPQSRFAKFHANQGLVLFIMGIVVNIVSSVVSTVAYFIGDALGALIGVLFGVVNIVLFVLMIMGIVNVVKGKAKELPIIGGIRIFK